ncbi:Abi family protein [Bifidobacterium sp. ESL0728]|uniref:Abi family protein n=1 Tax=Bifidobacterium sp. ESL0728 TaxID=2983220 RepID=UPI0023F92BD9|nr:Abi family protein [Bifidobacterium sp. ESL0728]WEV59032.1 Abi family protein [Bifidobacterium sp. ESL0728]
MNLKSNSLVNFSSAAPPPGSEAERALLACISPERLSTYQVSAQTRHCSPLELYLWDRDLASACMGDVALLEIALRNSCDRQLSKLSQKIGNTPDWYMGTLPFDDRSLACIRVAWKHLTAAQRQNHPHGHMIASLTFGFWQNLFDQGGFIHHGYPDQRKADYEEDFWRKGLNKVFPGGRRTTLENNKQWTRTYALNTIKSVHILRNRIAHHEPLIQGIPIPGEQRRMTLDEVFDSCVILTKLLDSRLSDWFLNNSKMQMMLAEEPQ